MSKDNKIFDLEERLINFAVGIIRTSESLPKTRAGNHIAGQLICCGEENLIIRNSLFDIRYSTHG